MKKILIFLLFISFNGFAQEANVRQAVAVFFEGFHARDTIKMKTAMTNEMVLQSVSESASGNKLETERVSEFLKSIATIPLSVKFEEKILSYEIKIDGAMAHVWAPYEFYVNGQLSHRGVNSFQLFNDGSIWKITYIIDTRRK